MLISTQHQQELISITWTRNYFVLLCYGGQTKLTFMYPTSRLGSRMIKFLLVICRMQEITQVHII